MTTPKDFMFQFGDEKPEPKKQSVEDQKTMLTWIFKAFGKKNG